jgi:hypothetical protein
MVTPMQHYDMNTSKELWFTQVEHFNQTHFYPNNKAAKAIVSIMRKRKALLKRDIEKLMFGGFEIVVQHADKPPSTPDFTDTVKK